VRGGVDEVRVADYGSGEAYDRTIESCDENFRVRVKSVGDVEVVGDEVLEVIFESVFRGGIAFAGYGDVGAAVGWVSRKAGDGFVRMDGYSRAEEASCAGQDGDEDVFSTVDVAEPLSDVEVEVLSQGSEFLGAVDGDDGDAATELALDLVGGAGSGVHGGRVSWRKCKMVWSVVTGEW
jgi:hypothetical protein